MDLVNKYIEVFDPIFISIFGVDPTTTAGQILLQLTSMMFLGLAMWFNRNPKIKKQ